MPNLKKLKTEDENMENNSDSEASINSEDMSESGDSDMSDDEEVVINFEARAMVESDLDSIKLLMQQKLGSFGINLGEIATILVQQENIGNVIYQAAEDGEEEIDIEEQTIFGVISCINFESVQAKSFVTKFKQFLIKECAKLNGKETVKKFEDILREKQISYLVNERYMNIPPAISLPMFESLKKDLEAESEKDDNNNNLKSDYWMLVTRHYAEKEANTTNLIYGNAEEEILEEFSDMKFEIRAGAQKKHRNEFDNEMTQVVNVCMVPYENIEKCIEKIKTMSAQ